MTQAAVDLLADLIAFPTVSSESNLALIDYCRMHLANCGVSSRLSKSADGAKANLLASIGPAAEGGVVLAGHTDVVPVANQQWSSDPFRLVERDGRLYGRGAADMKGFIAVVLAAAPALARARLRVPVHIALTFDEETGCFGVPLVIEQLRRDVPRPGAVVVGEPSDMRVINAHKGVRLFETTVTGREAHSSAPDKGANAVLAAARLMTFLAGVADEFKARGADGSAAGADFEPPWTTLNVGPVAGGTAHNIVPNRCSFRWELRLLPEQDPDEAPRRLAEEAEAHVLPALRAVAPGAAVETELIVDVPGLRPEAGSAAERLCLNLTGGNATGAVSFGSEAGMYQAAGLPTAICGPGSIEQAHRPDEHVTRAQLEACSAFMRRLVDWASAV